LNSERRLRATSKTISCTSLSVVCLYVCENAKTTCTDNAASSCSLALPINCASHCTAIENCIACRMHAQLPSEIQFPSVTTFAQNFSLPVAWASPLSAAHKPTLLCCATVAAWVDCGSSALQKPRPSWLAAGLLLDAGSALTKGGQVMFCPQPLHQLPSLGNCTDVAAWVDCGPRALQKLYPSWLAAVLLLDAASALARGGQVMFRPQPLHQLPSLGICARRKSNVLPSTVTSAP